MSGTTPRLHLPYPTDIDYLTNGDEAIEALAQAIDTQLAGVIAAPLYGPNIGPSEGGIAVAKYGTLAVIRLNFTATAAVAAGGLLCTIPAGSRPGGTAWQGHIGINHTPGAALTAAMAAPDGTVVTVSALAADGYRGMIVYLVP